MCDWQSGYFSRDVVQVKRSRQNGVEPIPGDVGHFRLPVPAFPHVNDRVGENLGPVIVNLLPHNVRSTLGLENVQELLLCSTRWHNGFKTSVMMDTACAQNARMHLCAYDFAKTCAREHMRGLERKQKSKADRKSVVQASKSHVCAGIDESQTMAMRRRHESQGRTKQAMMDSCVPKRVSRSANDVMLFFFMYLFQENVANLNRK